MNLSNDGIGTVKCVLKAFKFDTGRVKGTYCYVQTETSRYWVILSGAQLKMYPNDSLSDNDNYKPAYENYKNAREQCSQSGILRKHYYLMPKGSESQCLTILRGTPSSREHSKKYIDALQEDELQDILEELNHTSEETDDWRPEEKKEYEYNVENDCSDGEGIVYLLESENDKYSTLVKIGMTRRTLAKRINELEQQPAGLYSRCKELFYIKVPNPQTIEKGLHYIFAQYRKPIQFNGGIAEEWFDMDWQKAKRVMLILIEETSTENDN